MHELLQFLAVFAGIYLFDCVHWARRGTVGFRAWWWRRVRIVRGDAMPGNESFGIALAQPLPPFGRLYLTQSPPISLTREAATSFVVAAENPGTRAPQVERLVSLDAEFTLRVEARQVLVDGRVFVDAGSVRLARLIARRLRELSKLDPAARGARIRAWSQASLSVNAVQERVAQFERVSAVLRIFCGAQFLLVFGVTPAIGLTVGLAATWIPLTAALAVLQAAITWCFVRAHRALHPDEVQARRAEAFLLALSPPVAMRAFDGLSRDLLAEFHPLAAAAALLPRAEFAVLLEATMRDALHPLPLVREGADPAVRAAAEVGNAQCLEALTEFARLQGMKDEPWLRPPKRLDDECLAYCPRCVQQFTRTGGGCERCQDLRLENFRSA